MSLKGKKILITGAAKRIGREIAWQLAEAGAQILIHYHRSASEARALQKAINHKFKIEARLYRADLQNDRQILRLADQVWRENRHIDALVNNASTFFPTPLGQAKKSDFEKLFNVNVLAPLLLIDRLGTKMKKRGSGHIINVGDHSQMKPSVRFLTYTASKAALASLNQGFARALAPEVQVNHLLLGPILWPEDFSLKGKKSVLEKTLLKKAGNPQDIARMVEYLLLHGDYMTGCMIHIDGGASLA